MFLKKIFSHSKQEHRVTENIRRHIKLLCAACHSFMVAMQRNDKKVMIEVIDLEREGDTIRRDIISDIYEGAFLPYLRPDVCRFVEMVDKVFDSLEDAAFNCLDAEIPMEIRDECMRVAFLNARMCEMLSITYEAMLRGEDLREKTLAIRIYEKKIDDLKFIILKELRQLKIDDFWHGRILADLVSGLTSISDTIEDAGDYLHIINASMRS